MIIDSHCHLTYEPISNTLKETIDRANKDGIKYMLTISTEDKSFEQILRIVNSYESVYGTYGIHPHEAKSHQHIKSDDIIDKVNSILTKVGLAGLNNAFPYELSGGEQQRVCIARALVNNPKIILADEPTGNLDPNVSDEILDILENFTKSGSTVLMSTHNFPLIKPRKKRF